MTIGDKDGNGAASHGEDSAQTLRRLAEEKAARLETRDLTARPPEEVGRLLHELRVHQIELEMQNEELRCAQQEIEASRAKYFDLYELAPVGYLTLSEKGLILEANLTLAGLLGVPRGALIKQAVSQFIQQEDQNHYYRFLKQLLDTGAPQACELRMVKKGQPFIWMHVEMRAGRDAADAPLCRMALSDISTLKHAEEELREKHALLEFIFEGSEDAIFAKDRRGCYLMVNATAARLMGQLQTDILGKDDTAFFSSDNAAGIMKHDRDVMESRTVLTYEETLICHGVARTFLSTKGPVYNGGGKIVGLFGMAHDITDRETAEKVLRHKEEQLRTLGDNIPSGVLCQCLKTPDGRWSLNYMSAGVRKILGMPTDHAMPGQQQMWDRIVEADRLQLVAAQERSISQMIPVDCEFRYHTFSGEMKWLHARAMPHQLKDGSIAWDGVVIDITERQEKARILLAKATEVEEINKQLERFNHVAVGRELKMIELKTEINELCRAAGKPERYSVKNIQQQMAAQDGQHTAPAGPSREP